MGIPHTISDGHGIRVVDSETGEPWTFEPRAEPKAEPKAAAPKAPRQPKASRQPKARS